LKAVFDSHLIEVRVAGERQEACVLVFSAEPTYAHLSRRFHDGDLEHLAADFPMRRFALLLGEIDESLISNSLDETIAQQIQRKAKRPDRFCLRNSLLNLVVGKRAVGANRAIIHERPANDHFGSVSNRDFRIAEVSVRPLVADA
jgi:hypothetical protein